MLTIVLNTILLLLALIAPLALILIFTLLLLLVLEGAGCTEHRAYIYF
jgi:hypothetical protein